NVVAAFTRINDSSNPTPQGPNGKPICYSQLIPVYDPPSSPCEIDALGVGDWFVQGNFNYLSRRTWSVADNVNIVKRKHLRVAGVDVLHQYWNLGTDWLATIPFFFDGTYTNNPLADFLLGDVSAFYQDSGEYQQLKQTQIAPYFTDQIKLTPHFTITAGL